MHLPCLIVWRAIHSLKHRSKWQSLSGIEEKGIRKKIEKINERRSCFLSCLPPLGLVLTHGRCATMEKQNKMQSRAFVRSRAQARSLFFLLSSLFSLLSSLFSHLLVVVVSRLLDPKCRVTHSTQSLPFFLFSLPPFIFFLLSSIFFLPSTNLAVRQFGHFRLFFSHLFSVLSSRSSGCLSTLESANPYLNTTFSLLSSLFCQVSDRAND